MDDTKSKMSMTKPIHPINLGGPSIAFITGMLHSSGLAHITDQRKCNNFQLIKTFTLFMCTHVLVFVVVCTVLLLGSGVMFLYPVYTSKNQSHQ